MQSATYPISTSTYAFRSLDDVEGKRSDRENSDIARWAFDGTTTLKPFPSTCTSTAFGMQARPTGSYDIGLETAIDGNRQKTWDFVPEQHRDKIPKEPTFKTLPVTPLIAVCADNDFLRPRNTHLERGTKGSVVSDIQVTRNDALAIPPPPSAYIFGNRPQVGVNVRRTIRDNVAYQERRIQLNEDAKKRRDMGLTW